MSENELTYDAIVKAAAHLPRAPRVTKVYVWSAKPAGTIAMKHGRLLINTDDWRLIQSVVKPDERRDTFMGAPVFYADLADEHALRREILEHFHGDVLRAASAMPPLPEPKNLPRAQLKRIHRKGHRESRRQRAASPRLRPPGG